MAEPKDPMTIKSLIEELKKLPADVLVKKAEVTVVNDGVTLCLVFKNKKK